MAGTEKLFDDDDQQDELVLAVDEPQEEVQKEEEQQPLPWWRDRAYLEQLAERGQIPLVFLFTIGLLSLLWSMVGRGDRPEKLEYGVESASKRREFKSENFKNFNRARRDAAQVEQSIQQLLNPLGPVSSARIREYLDAHDASAFEGNDIFVVNRMGDLYAQTVMSRFAKDGDNLRTDEIRTAERWLRNNLSGPGSLRSKDDTLKSLVTFNEELGDRTRDSDYYAKGLNFLDEWHKIDPGKDRHWQRATLHFKADDEDNRRLAREFIEASTLSTEADEVENRHLVLTMLGKIYAKDGQIREAERQFKSLLDDATSDHQRAETSLHLGEMREILAHRAHADQRNAIPEFEKAEEAFREAFSIFDSHSDESEESLRQREIARFHIGSVKLFRGLLHRDNNGDVRELNEARDIFSMMRRFKSVNTNPTQYAINVRRAQVNTALGRGDDAEEILEDVMGDHREKYWDRTRLVRPDEVVQVIHGLSDVHDRERKFRRQVKVLQYLDLFLEKDDKEGRTRNTVAIARAWIRDAESRIGPEARVSRRHAAGTYLDLLEEPLIKLQKGERLDVLWNSYLQYKNCFDQANLKLWKIALERKDKDSAIDVLNRIIATDPSPRTNNLLNQALYIKGLLQEELFRIPEAIETYEDNIDTLDRGGDNIYVYLSYLQKARARSSLGGTDNLDQAIKDCEALFDHVQIDPKAEPWRDARFLHGSLNLRLAMRMPETSPERKNYLRDGIRSLDEAIERYPDSPLRLKAHVDAGLAKIHMSKLNSTDNVRYVESAIADFDTAEKLAQSKSLSQEDRDLKKIAMMNLGLAYMELEGNHLPSAANTFDRLARAFRRDRVEPWALVQLHRTYRQLADIARNTARQNQTPELRRQIVEYITQSQRASEKAISSWDQIIKLSTPAFQKDFPLDYWRDNDKWLLNLEIVIDRMKARRAANP